MSTIKRIAGTSASLTGTASLNSLGSTNSVLLDEYNNSTNLWPSADFEFALTFGTAPSDNAQIELWIVPAADGSNYCDGSSSVAARANLSIGVLLVRNVNTAQRLMMRDVPIPPYKFKLLVKNSTSQGLAASGNSATIFPHGLQSV